MDAAITDVGLAPDRSMETPPLGSGLVGWYDRGPKPGEDGPAVLAGHVSSAAHGPDVFHRLVEVAPGDEIHVDLADGGRFDPSAARHVDNDIVDAELP